jgi:hypothetical protein
MYRQVLALLGINPTNSSYNQRRACEEEEEEEAKRKKTTILLASRTGLPPCLCVQHGRPKTLLKSSTH